MTRKNQQKLRRRSAQSLVEYALILAFVAMVAVVMLRGLGGTTNNLIAPVNSTLSE
jgi:Flp pilus assembly pilin Flp